MVINLGHQPGNFADTPSLPSFPFTGLKALVFESVGPVRHQVSIPFHDSQVRGAALLIHTGWDQRWGTEAYWEPGPVLAEHLLFRMNRAGVRLAGVDFPVSGPSAGTRLLTTGNVAIVENLRGLAQLPPVGVRFTVVPLATEQSGICAVDAFAEFA
jgi:arylformamidase